MLYRNTSLTQTAGGAGWAQLAGGAIQLLSILWLIWGVSGPLHAAEATREKILAAYLYRFLDFVDFPSNTPAASGSFTICVVGDQALADSLETSVRGKSIAGHPVSIRALSDIREVKTCHVLFTTGRKSLVSAQFSDLQHEPILTVSDLPGLDPGDAVITMNLNDNRIRFGIDVESAKRRGLTISSRLIQLSRSFQ